MNSDNGLLAWKWNAEIVDAHSAADADTDTALALVMAGRRWANPEWQSDGSRMVQAIWDHDVVRAGDAAYVAAGDWAPALDTVPVNPSYFAPYAYHVFQEVDPGHDWLSLVDSGYRLLFDSSAAALGSDQSAGLPPDWISIDRSSGQVVPLAVDADQTTVYGYDAPRAYWRVALDLNWNGDGRAAPIWRRLASCATKSAGQAVSAPSIRTLEPSPATTRALSAAPARSQRCSRWTPSRQRAVRGSDPRRRRLHGRRGALGQSG